MTDVWANFQYLRQDSAKSGFIMQDHGQETIYLGSYHTKRMYVQDARHQTTRFSLDEQGFSLLNSPALIQDHMDEEMTITSLYYPHISTLLSESLQAEKVIIIDHTLRSSAPTSDLRRTATHVHNDYTAASCLQRLQDSVGNTQAKAWSNRRLIQVNTWQPLMEPVTVAPLGLLDGSSVVIDDLVPSPIIYPDRRGEIYSVRHNPNHRWYYFSQMRRDEILLFKGFDSADSGQVKFTPHAAFQHPDSKPDDPPRRSIEVRALVMI